jgi:hypothetical protein
MAHLHAGMPEQHSQYSFTPSLLLFQDQKNLTRLNACNDVDTLCQMIVDTHNQTKGDHEKLLQLPLPGLTSAIQVLGGASHFFDFSNTQGLWRRLIRRAAQLDTLFPNNNNNNNSIPTLSRRGGTASVNLSSAQITCILSNAFLGNLSPLPLPVDRQLPRYGSLSWHHVYQSGRRLATERAMGLLLYLQQTLLTEDHDKDDERVITFRRIQLPESLDLLTSLKAYRNLMFRCIRLPESLNLLACLKAYGNQPLAPVVFSTCSVEAQESATGMVDFSNRNLHVAEIWPSAAQEEINFSIFPEAFPGLLICETMGVREAIQIPGVRQFVSYSGFQNSFVVDGIYERRPFEQGAGKTMIAMDASLGRLITPQCEGPVCDWDILKAYAGFHGLKGQTIATGNWGCGSMGGNPYAKFVHQLLAASLAGVSLVYCLIEKGSSIVQDFEGVERGLRRRKVTALELYRGLGQYNGGEDPDALRNYLIKKYA